jgi:hypothetical protein
LRVNGSCLQIVGDSHRMNTKLHSQFVKLLMSWPDWRDKDVREGFLQAALGDHILLEGFGCSDHPQSDADRLAKRCGDFGQMPADSGLSPACAVLNKLTERWPVVELKAKQLARTLSVPEAAPPAWSGPPFPGLRPLTCQEATIFFGREAETDDLLRSLGSQQGQRLLIVTGASGAGKSSPVRAGLCARLRKRAREGSEDWMITAMKPDPGVPNRDAFDNFADSLREADVPALSLLNTPPEARKLRADAGYFPILLDRVLEDCGPNAHWLLILDQMEELFTPPCAAVRDKFFAWCRKAVQEPRFRIVATLRADFFKDCTVVKGLPAYLNDKALYVLERPDDRALADMDRWPGRGARSEDR